MKKPLLKFKSACNTDTCVYRFTGTVRNRQVMEIYAPEENAVYAYNTFYLATKNGIISFAGKQMGLEVTMLNEISLAWKDKYTCPHLWNLDLRKKNETRWWKSDLSGEEGHRVERDKTGSWEDE